MSGFVRKLAVLAMICWIGPVSAQQSKTRAKSECPYADAQAASGDVSSLEVASPALLP